MMRKCTAKCRCTMADWFERQENADRGQNKRMSYAREGGFGGNAME